VISIQVEQRDVRHRYSLRCSTAWLTSVNAAGSLSTYTYDGEYRLVSVDAAGSLSTYSYDGDGLRRSAHEAGGALTTFVWDGDDYLLEKTP
jgi:YD repeat-containing protein